MIKLHHPQILKPAVLTFLLAFAGFIPGVPTLYAAAIEPVYTEQGNDWTAAKRLQYYSQDQGSRLIPLKWVFALKQENGRPFMEDSLARHGYLPNSQSNPKGLPVGFTVNGDAMGMTCSACHTRQIEVDGQAYRIDGGPAIADFQGFSAELDRVVDHTLNDPKAFDEFAAAVLGATPSEEQKSRLRKQFSQWFLPYHTIMSKALPASNPWGPARLDAVGMIFNRLTGLDIGTSPDHIIASNIRLANAPVRYPFLWNAAIQDKTQWPGFAENGNDLLGLARNYGEVVGVFADFYPKKASWRILGIDYLKENSANFDGLKKLEHLIKLIGPPKWPWKQGKWAVNQALATTGKAIYESTTQTESGGCIGCHGIRPGMTRPVKNKTWATPLCNVNTDVKEFELFAWTVDSGVLAGAEIPFLDAPLKAKDELAIKVLTVAGSGSLLQYITSSIIADLELKAQNDLAIAEKLIGKIKTSKSKDIRDKLEKHQSDMVTPETSVLQGAYQAMPDPSNMQNTGEVECKDKFTDPKPSIAYESRVLEGIWATAPYLHNGSVPTLAALLEPAENRPVQFKVGPSYDPDKIGLAVEQTKFDYVLKTTDCKGSNIQSGNSRCGHEFGTKLSKEDKAALLEYMKIL